MKPAVLIALDSVGIDPLGHDRPESVYGESAFLFPRGASGRLLDLPQAAREGALVETDVTGGRTDGAIECAITYATIFTSARSRPIPPIDTPAPESSRPRCARSETDPASLAAPSAWPGSRRRCSASPSSAGSPSATRPAPPPSSRRSPARFGPPRSRSSTPSRVATRCGSSSGPPTRSGATLSSRPGSSATRPTPTGRGRRPSLRDARRSFPLAVLFRDRGAAKTLLKGAGAFLSPNEVLGAWAGGLTWRWTVEPHTLTGTWKHERRNAHLGRVMDLALSPDGSILYSVGTAREDRDGGELRVWSVAERRQLRPTLHHPVPIVGVAVSPDGERLLLSTRAGFELWDASVDAK